jgi:hypothetical protein
MDIANFFPDALPDRTLDELQSLTREDISALARIWPAAPAVFLIRPTDRQGNTSLATYRSLDYLWRVGFKFEIVGTTQTRKKAAEPAGVPLPEVAHELGKVEHIAPEQPVFKAEPSRKPAARPAAKKSPKSK